MANGNGLWWITVQLGNDGLVNPLADKNAVEASIAHNLGNADENWREVSRTDDRIELVNGRKRSERITYVREA